MVYVFIAMHIDIAFSHLQLSLLLIRLTSLMVEYDPVTVSKKTLTETENSLLSYHAD